MTQDVQPLTWQKRTNIEEHRQFFTKINEIIDNLAPTVAEAEAATAEANAAIVTANAASAAANNAVTTANAASANANTAANTVAGYDARLTEVEETYIKDRSDTVQVIDSDLQITNGHDLAVAGDVNIAGGVNASGQSEIAGMAIEKSGNVTVLSNDNGISTSSPVTVDDITVGGTATITEVPTTATGQRDLRPVNGTRVQNDLDAYASMVRTSGNQIIAGYKSFAAGVFSDFVGRPAGEMVTNNYIMITYPRNNGMVSRFEVIDYRTSDFVKLDAILATCSITDGVIMAVKLGTQTLASGDFMYGYDSENIYVFFKVRSWHNVALRTIITRGNGNMLITPTLSYVVNPDMSSITTTDAVVS